MLVGVMRERDDERALAVSYAAPAARPALVALLALDKRLGTLVREARDPLIGQMRLTWWFEALERLDTTPPPAEPVLRGLAATVLPRGVSGGALAAMVEGWETLLEGERLDEEALASFGRERGGRLFSAAATVLGGADPRMHVLGEGWALADLAMHWRDQATRDAAAAMALIRLNEVFRRPLPLKLRSLGALGLLARSDLAGVRPGSPARVGRLLLHRLAGR